MVRMVDRGWNIDWHRLTCSRASFPGLDQFVFKQISISCKTKWTTWKGSSWQMSLMFIWFICFINCIDSLCMTHTQEYWTILALHCFGMRVLSCSASAIEAKPEAVLLSGPSWKVLCLERGSTLNGHHILRSDFASVPFLAYTHLANTWIPRLERHYLHTRLAIQPDALLETVLDTINLPPNPGRSAAEFAVDIPASLVQKRCHELRNGPVEHAQPLRLC